MHKHTDGVIGQGFTTTIPSQSPPHLVARDWGHLPSDAALSWPPGRCVQPGNSRTNTAIHKTHEFGTAALNTFLNSIITTNNVWLRGLRKAHFSATCDIKRECLEADSVWYT